MLTRTDLRSAILWRGTYHERAVSLRVEREYPYAWAWSTHDRSDSGRGTDVADAVRAAFASLKIVAGL